MQILPGYMKTWSMSAPPESACMKNRYPFHTEDVLLKNGREYDMMSSDIRICGYTMKEKRTSPSVRCGG